MYIKVKFPAPPFFTAVKTGTIEFAKIRIKSYNILLSTIPKEAQNLTKPDISSPQKSPYFPVLPLKSELIEIMEKQYVKIFKAQKSRKRTEGTKHPAPVCKRVKTPSFYPQIVYIKSVFNRCFALTPDKAQTTTRSGPTRGQSKSTICLHLNKQQRCSGVK